MRKSDDEIRPGEAHVEHFQKVFLLDKVLIVLMYISGGCRAIFAIGALIVGFHYAPPKGYGANTVETLIHTFLYDFNYAPFLNLLFSLGIILSAYLLKNKIKQGYTIYLLLHLTFILLALRGLSESDMNYQSFYWVLSGAWIILLTWRKRYMI